jgi:tRNA modification GTPase
MTHSHQRPEVASQGDSHNRGTGLYRSDTIIAPGTAPGSSAIAVVRLSGHGVAPCLTQLFRSATRKSPFDRPRELVLGDLLDSSAIPIDRGMAVWFPGPSTPTGEDYAELHVHGSPGIVALILQAAQTFGVRPAEPGEFLRRAFLNGRINLTQADGVAAALAATTVQAARSAARNLRGELTPIINDIRQNLLVALAILEAATDFPDEDLPPTDEKTLTESLTCAASSLQKLLAGARRSLLCHTGARVVLAGPPNAGKSSLFNYLVGHERAIVSPEPGTTRDTIEAVIDLEGIPVTLVDTAGLRPDAGPVEQAGIQRTHQEILHADLVLYLVPADQSAGVQQNHFVEVPQNCSCLIIHTKSDLVPDNIAYPNTPLRVSARTGQGTPELLRAMVTMLRGEQDADLGGHGLSTWEGLLTSERQIRNLTESRQAVHQAEVARADNLGPELVSIHLREALQPLDALLGLDSSEDLLTVLFSRFCIGK